ncbi:hypothetical protein SAMN05444274_103389 [Mariniphaga anaerophila]|uniref:Uncharacterized protein n=1 Tax=Mariniphaga anaerophila TaxID=1484053 RepID=A0A1M4YKH6_9BACT|nr:hypothetical protein [Mariniphaga anaerophila]SHF06355.1 hypothetical protein SAMN05444274_103389 [Mariniphaga anaerophila]
MKRNLIIVVLIVLAAVGGYFYFSNERSPFLRDTSVYKAVPVSSPFFFELSSIRSIPFGDPFIREMENAGIGKNWFEFLHKADSLIDVTEELPRSLRNSSFLLAYGIAGRNELIPLLATQAESHSRRNALGKFLKTVYPPGKYNYDERDYGKYKIQEISGENNQDILFFSYAEDLLLVSPRVIIIEQVIRQFSVHGIENNPYFLDVNKTAGTQGVSLYINHKWINSLFAEILNRTAIQKVDEFGATSRIQYSSKAEKFRDFAEWSELDFRFNNGQLLLNGVSAVDDSLNHFLTVFDKQQPVRYRAGEILPQNTSFYCSYSFSDKKLFFEKLEDFFMHSPAYYHREERMKRFDRGFRGSVRNAFQEMVNDEVIVATSTIPVDPSNKTTFFIIHTESRSGAEEQFQKLMSGYASRTETEMNKLYTDFEIDKDVRFRIYRFPYPSFPGLWMGSPFGIADARVAVFYDNYLVFSNSEQGLQEYLRNMVLGATLSGDNNYQRFIQSSSSRSNINVYADINRAFGLRNEILSPSFLEQIKEKEETIRRYGQVNWQVQHDKGIFFNSLAIQAHSAENEEAKTTWQSSVGSNVATKPLMVLNHTDKSNREIIFQDAQNNLQLVAGSGRVRWSVPISGSVLGEIYQIDYFKNGRLQYLFNTKDKLYLIDRNGNNVGNFPIALRSPATNGVSVFDYDNNRNYRYFVAGEDRKIYAYDYSGKIISGWSFGQTDFSVTTPVQHFRVAGKDYIVFNDKSRIYIQNRQGETRVPVSARFDFSKNPVKLSLEGTPKIVATDSGGKVHYIYFNGKTEEKKTARYSSNHFFTVDDLDGNGTPDFVFVDGNEVTVMDENGKKLFGKKLDNPVQHQPNVYTFSSKLKKVGVVDAVSNRIYLFAPDGKIHQGFPLQGNSEFSIGKLSDSSTGLNLVVGSEGGKLYNYTLN